MPFVYHHNLDGSHVVYQPKFQRCSVVGQTRCEDFLFVDYPNPLSSIIPNSQVFRASSFTTRAVCHVFVYHPATQPSITPNLGIIGRLNSPSCLGSSRIAYFIGKTNRPVRCSSKTPISPVSGISDIFVAYYPKNSVYYPNLRSSISPGRFRPLPQPDDRRAPSSAAFRLANTRAQFLTNLLLTC